MSKKYATCNLLLQLFCSSPYDAVETVICELGTLHAQKTFFIARIYANEPAVQALSNSRVMSKIFTQ